MDKKEKDFILSQPFKIWPPAKPGKAYGPSEMQRKVFVIPHKHKLDICYAGGGGRCFGPGTKVRMADGSIKRIENIRQLDMVMGPDDQPRVVNATFLGRESMYKVSYSLGFFTCNESHALALKVKDAYMDIEIKDFADAPEDCKLYDKNGLEYNFDIEYLGPGNFYGFTLSGDCNKFLLADGIVAANSGKSVAAAAKGLEYLLKYPGATAIIGAENSLLLERTAQEEWRKRLSVYSDWDHPLVFRRPTKHTKRLRLTNGSTAWFLHFSDFKILRGTQAVFIQIEEASLIKDRNVLDELIRRSSGSEAPQRMILLTSNPEENKGWIYDAFSLKQFEPGYIESGGKPIPIGRPCKCQFCNDCLDQRNIEVGWVDNVCPVCKTIKDTDCPGNQEFMRVILSSPLDNPHLPSDYFQTNKAAASDELIFDIYTRGMIKEVRSGFVYKNYSNENVLKEELNIDEKKELHWTFDFNVSYQCSNLLQVERTTLGDVCTIIDEIILPEAGPEHVAKEFHRRYPHFPNLIKIWGDPSALNRETSPDETSRFQIIYNILTKPKEFLSPEEYIAFGRPTPKKVEIMVRKIKRMTKIPVVPRVDSTNTLFLDSSGIKRLFINPHCRYTMRSLEDLRWKEGSNNSQMDVSCDKNAARNPDKRSTCLLSHPTDALGYFVYKNYPLLEPATPQVWAQIPGGSTANIDKDNNMVEMSYIEDQEEAPETIIKEDSFFRDMFSDPDDFGLGGYYW